MRIPTRGRKSRLLVAAIALVALAAVLGPLVPAVQAQDADDERVMERIGSSSDNRAE